MPDKTLALALILNAKDGGAYKVVDTFASKAANRLATFAANSQRLMKSGLADIEIGKAILSPIMSAAREAGVFEERMVGSAKELGIALNSKNFDSLKESALKTTVAIHGTTEETAALYSQFVASGASAKELDGLTVRADRISKALDITREAAAATFIGLRNDLKITSEQTDTIMDQANTAINKFGGHADSIFSVLKSQGSIAMSTLRFTSEGLVSLSNAADHFGVSGDNTAVVLRKMVQVLSNNGGLRKTFVDAGGGIAGFTAILDKANKSGNASAFFLKNGFVKQASDLSKMASHVSEIREQSEFLKKANTKGSINSEAGIVNNTRTEQIKKFNAQLDTLKITAGNALLPALNSLTQSLGPLIDRFAKFAKDNPKLLTSLVKMAAGMGAAKIAIGGLKLGVGGLGKPLGWMVDMFGKNKEGVSKFGTALNTAREGFNNARTSLKNLRLGLAMSGQIGKFGFAFKALSFIMRGPVILAIAAIAAGVFLIIKNWDKIKAWFSKLWDKVKSVFSAAWEWIKDMFLNYTPYGLVIKHWDTIVDAFKSIWDKVKNIFSSAWDWIKDSAIGRFIGKIVGVGKSAFSGMSDIVHTAANGSLAQTVQAVQAGSENAGMSTFMSGAPALPQLTPNRPGNTFNSPFNMTVNLSGSATQADADRISQSAKRAWELQYTQMKYDQQRRAFK